jgi:hypothetical protein
MPEEYCTAGTVAQGRALDELAREIRSEESADYAANAGNADLEEVLARGGGSREFEADVARTQAAFEDWRTWP